MRKGATSVVTTVAAIELLTSSCTAPQVPDQPPTSTVQVDPETERYDQYLTGPESPCLSKYEPTEEEALACLAVQQNTRIALVNFDFTPKEAQEIAANVKVPFDRSTNGVFNAEPVVIPATQAAKNEAAKRHSGCVDEFMDFASIAAQATMPEELSGDKVDMVIALTKTPACDPAILGQAEGSRYADILAGPISSHLTMQNLGRAAAHEAGHLAGMDHASDLWCEPGLGSAMEGPEVFDVKAYLRNCELVEYGTSSKSVMGNALMQDSVPFEAALPQIPEIMWPQEKLGGPEAELAVEATPTGATINAKAAQADKFISVSLDETPLDSTDDLKITGGPEGEVTIDSLAIVPAVDMGDKDRVVDEPYIWGGTVYFHTVGNGVIHGDYLPRVNSGESRTTQLRVGDKLITVSLAGGRLAVSTS